MTKPITLLNSIIVMIVGILLSILIMFSLGLSLDMIYLQFQNHTILMDVSDNWDTSSQIFALRALFFISAMLPALVGILVFIVSAVKRQEYDIYETGYQGQGPGTIPTEVTRYNE